MEKIKIVNVPFLSYTVTLIATNRFVTTFVRKWDQTALPPEYFEKNEDFWGL